MTDGWRSQKSRDDHVRRKHPKLDLERLRAEEERDLPDHIIRPFRCRRPDCPRATSGFTHKRALKEHREWHERSDLEAKTGKVKKIKFSAHDDSEDEAEDETDSETGTHGQKAIGWLHDEDEEDEEEDTSNSNSKALVLASDAKKKKPVHRGTTIATGGFTSMLLKQVQQQ